MGGDRPPETRPAPYVLLCQIWSSYIKRYELNYGDLLENGHLTSRLSRWLKISEIDTDRSATYDFLLVIQRKHVDIGKVLLKQYLTLDLDLVTPVRLGTLGSSEFVKNLPQPSTGEALSPFIIMPCP